MTANSFTGTLHETDVEVITSEIGTDSRKPSYRKQELVWRNIILMALAHLGALYGFYLAFTSAKFVTFIFSVIYGIIAGVGVTAGAHRLWAHKSYKVNWPLNLLLMICNSCAFQDAVLDWARDHRVHHKYSETDADPYNAKRGFFFSHVGWLLCRKHPDIKNKGKGVDMSDLYADPILRFQQKYYLILVLLFTFAVPTWIPSYFWGESIKNAFYLNLMRYILSLHSTWLVNSAAHMFGSKPYDKFINPAENKLVAFATFGEGWHNYHHTFPWDYKTAELGNYGLNWTCSFINLMAKIGWAYDLKTVPQEMIMMRVERTGDGSHNLWGWGDADQLEEEKRNAIIVNKRR